MKRVLWIYLLEAKTEHELTNEEYRAFTKMSKEEKVRFLESGRFQVSEEQIYLLPNTTKFKLKR